MKNDFLSAMIKVATLAGRRSENVRRFLLDSICSQWYGCGADYGSFFSDGSLQIEKGAIILFYILRQNFTM